VRHMIICPYPQIWLHNAGNAAYPADSTEKF
jgi:hypothetical protein